MNFDTDALITRTTEEYIHHFRREITMKKDGFWSAVWSVMPFTDTKTDDTEICHRTVEHVSFRELKNRVKEEASHIQQSGIEKAKAAGKEQYGKLRQLMMVQFDNIDIRLKEFEEELKQKLEDQNKENEKLTEYRKVLGWVKKFQANLEHVLDLEV